MELALKGRPYAIVFRHGSQGIHFHPFPVGRPSGADLDGAFPGLKAWAVLLNRFAVRSIDLCMPWAKIFSRFAANPTGA